MLRRGVTLVELLVSVGIIAMLIALLLPAVQSARESSRRLQCQTRIRQTLAATHAHHDAKRSLPSLYGGLSPPYPLVPQDQPDRHSWRVALLPFLEQSQLWDQVRWDVCALAVENTAVAQSVVSELVCPSDPSIMGIGFRPIGDDPAGLAEPFNVATSDYEAAAGILIDPRALVATAASSDLSGFVLYGAWGHPVFKGQASLLGQIGSYEPGRFGDVTSGLSRTVALVERAGKPDKWLNGKTTGDPGAYPGQRGWSASDFLFRVMNLYGVGVNEANYEGMYSFHPGGANIGMADGSVRFLADTTSFDAIVGLYGGSVERVPERP